VAVFAAHGVPAPIEPALRGVLASALAVPGGALMIEARLSDGRIAHSALIRQITWEGRAIGALVALREAAWPGVSFPRIDRLARLAALDLYQSYRDLRTAAATGTIRSPSQRVAEAPAPAAASRRRPLMATVLATVVAQLLGADAVLLLGGPSPRPYDLAAIAAILATAVQILALAALGSDGALRTLLAVLLLAFVAAGLGILLAATLPALAAIRAAEAVLALAGALIAARSLRAGARAIRPLPLATVEAPR
jgi:hypothetical protein